MTLDAGDRDVGGDAVPADQPRAPDDTSTADVLAPDPDDLQPRLPNRDVDLVRQPPPRFDALPEQLASVERPNLARSVVPLGARSSVAIEEFVEPELLTMRPWNRAVVLSRFAAFTWAGAVAISALLVRSRARDGFDDGSPVTVVGRAGVLVAALLLAVGWMWSDRRARNVKLLSGRLPTRLRCATAWLSPGLFVALLAVAVVPLEPGELLDIRPAIITVVFTAAMWRPYALVRRTLATLIRTPSDALVGTAFVLDVAGFGLLWWQLTTWPSVITADTWGSLDTMVGVGFATVLALGLNVVVWAYLVRAVEVGEAHRLSSLRTRHEHRILRLGGIDPTDPDVWWALVHRRIARQRELGVPEHGGAGEPEASIAASPEALVERLRARHSHAIVRLGREGSAELVERLRAQLAAVMRLPGAEPKPERTDDPGVIDEPQPTRAQTDRNADDPLESLKRRLGLETPDGKVASDEALSRLLDQASLAQVEAALAERTPKEPTDDDSDAVRMVPPRLVWLDASRYILLLAFTATTGIALWLVRETLSARLGGAEPLPVGFVEDVDAARRALIISFTIALAIVPLWAAVVSSYARRASVLATHERWLLAMFVANSAVAVASYLVDGANPGRMSLLLQIPALALAVWSARSVDPVARWFGVRTARLTAWTFQLPVMFVALWVGRFQRSIEITDSPQVMAFFAVVVAILASVVVVAMALSAADLDDAIRLSPELAVPAGAHRR